MLVAIVWQTYNKFHEKKEHKEERLGEMTESAFDTANVNLKE